jgi:hypothetical protein
MGVQFLTFNKSPYFQEIISTAYDFSRKDLWQEKI